MRAAIAFVLVAFTLPSAAQNFERVLLPIAFRGEVPGAYGTRWTSFGMIWNDGTGPVEFFLGPPAPADPAPLNPRTFSILLPEPHDSQGAYVYFTRGADVKFASLLREAARLEENAGAEMPVVRESDFANRIVLPIVLTRGPWRTALRIYGEAPVPVHVRMYRVDRTSPFVDEMVVLQGSDPSYHHVFDLLARWPQLQAGASARIELDSEGKIWAFASQTNNVTQLVSTVRPQ